MADRNPRLLVVALLIAVTPLAGFAQSPPLPALPVQVQSAPPDIPPVGIGQPQQSQPPLSPPIGPLPPQGGYGGPPSTFIPSGPQPPLSPPIGSPPPPGFNVVAPPPPIYSVPGQPPAVGIGIGLPPPVIPPGPLFIQGQPPRQPQIEDGTPFIGLQVDGVVPVITDHLQITFPRNDGTAITVQPAANSLTWTISPKVELGWHLPECGGDFVLSYRYIATDGTGLIANPAGDFNIKSELNVNLFDLDYVSPPDEFAPGWDVRYRLGARVAAAFYETTASGATRIDQASNNFIGVGPHGGLEFRWVTPLTAFSLFARADGTILVGQVTQKYYETIDQDPNSPMSGNIKINRTNSVPTFSASTGLNYTPPAAKFLHFAIGYQWERWWRLGDVNGANLDLTTNSVFLRGEFDF
jgi:Legionella pneumophila major outer membrane protein precursor